jgi:hypothetical protein
LTIRTTSAISTENHKEGEPFTATLEEPLSVGGRVVARKGAEVTGRVADADAGGRVRGRATIAVALTSLRLADGRTLALETGRVEKEAESSAKKDAAKIGIGAGIGAAIGAIAGGGKGAAIGAGVGGAAGTGTVLATRGNAATIPSESVLTFRLTAPARTE